MATVASAGINDISNSKNSLGENPSQTLDPTISSSAQPPVSVPLSSTDGGSSKEMDESKGSDKTSVEGDGEPVSDVQRKMRRAERFGISVQLSEEEKRNSRAERFGMGTTTNGLGASNKSEEVKRKARAERFGLPASVATDDEAKKKARLGRFSSTSKPDSQEEEKRKARAIRFSNPTSNSLTQVDGKGNIETIADIAGKAGGGA
ncbi:protein MODIFIER OF SNC1 11-like [Cucurbita maxima]|uniref:Protein MODIFIER OF SNC1 11-like n=1 Tax=Cucurbita maxima TaxID=3661 RepID=A0A6J1IR28_CUCMA|nr:protein MODIFIER OF SNC1 11-like [Cucurbita maxima]XP_022977778.1 protein MODIFIER OF SNC1 11-like [Cucurbita maxima]XP_022977779.1 protein MODIFIER OF SNC1 11-like [Cucurbita maxima]